MLICSITLFELICMHVENVFFKHKGLFHRHEPEKKLAYLWVKITWIILIRIISLNMDFYIVQMQSWQVTRKIVACTLCLMEKFQHFSLCSDLKGKRFACCWIVVILLIILTFFFRFHVANVAVYTSKLYSEWTLIKMLKTFSSECSKYVSYIEQGKSTMGCNSNVYMLHKNKICVLTQLYFQQSGL